MEQITPREELWVDKKTMREFLKEPLNQKLYDVFLSIKRNSPSQDFHTLQLFNEVYYICSHIVFNNCADIDLANYIREIKDDMGWDYPSSIVLNMVYVVLSLRKGNTSEVNGVLKKIKQHYKMDVYNSPWSRFVDEELQQHSLYDVKLGENSTIDFLSKEIASVMPLLRQTIKDHANRELNITLNVNNQFTGEIKNMRVAHSDVAVGVAERGAHVFHHKECNHEKE